MSLQSTLQHGRNSRTWRLPKHPSVREWTNKFSHSQKKGTFDSIKIENLELHLSTGLHLKTNKQEVSFFNFHVRLKEKFNYKST